MVFVIGLPIFLIELGLGQFSSMGPAHMYANLTPIFKGNISQNLFVIFTKYCLFLGVGLASIIASVIVGIYYNMIIAWTLFYFVHSFLGEGWNYCTNSFNT